MNQGQSPDVPGVNDLQYFEETLNALRLLEFTEREQDDMLKILASVLHLGNITFHECIIETENEQDQEGCAIKVFMKFFSDLFRGLFLISTKTFISVDGGRQTNFIFIYV